MTAARLDKAFQAAERSQHHLALKLNLLPSPMVSQACARLPQVPRYTFLNLLRSILSNYAWSSYLQGRHHRATEMIVRGCRLDKFFSRTRVPKTLLILALCISDHGLTMVLVYQDNLPGQRTASAQSPAVKFHLGYTIAF